MARKLNMVLVLALATMALLQNSALGATYIVGDSANWQVPTSPDAYSNWAAGKRFIVGDILVFNFAAGAHDVAEVRESGYDNCDGTNPIFRQTSSPVSITLRTAGQHFYICTVPGHCSMGQSLAINVTGALTPSPQPGDSSPAPSPTQVPARPPRPFSPAPTPSTRSFPPSTDTASPTPASDIPPIPTTTAAAPAPKDNGAASFGAAGLSASLLFGLALALLF